MVEALVLTLAVGQILLQAIAAGYAFQVLRRMGATRFWVLVIAALLFMGLRRVTALTIELGWTSALTGEIAFLDRQLLPFAISVFLFLGLYELHQRLSKKT